MGPDTFSALLGALYKRRLTVFIVLAASLGSGWWFVSTVPPLYQASATLFVRDDLPRLSLDSIAPSLPEGAVLPDSTEAVRVGLLGIASSNAVYQRLRERVPELQIDQLRERIILDIDPAQQLLVLANDADRSQAVRLANEFVAAVAEHMSEMAERHPQITLAALEAEEPRAQREYLLAQDALLTYLTSVGSPDLEKDLQLLVQERQDLRAALAEIDLAEQRSAAQIPVVEQRLAERPEFVLARRTVVESTAYRAALNEVAGVRAKLAVAGTRYHEEHPAMLQLRSRLRAAEERVRVEAERGMEQLQTQYEPDPQARSLVVQLVEMQVAAAGIGPARVDLLGRLQQVDTALDAMPLSQAELARLDYDIEVAKAHLSRVTQRVAELELQLKRGIEPVYVDPLNLASEDRVVELPSQIGVLAFSAFAGLMGGLLLAVATELLAQARRKLPF